MPSLRQQQTDFINSILTDAIPNNTFIPHNNLGSRIEVYRRNFMEGYYASLKKTFPMTAQYLEDTFETYAVSYICTHRPKVGQLLATYGATFPQYLEDPISQELARLEWNLQTILMAQEDVNTILPYDITTDDIIWQLRSDVALFNSAYPIHQLYVALSNTKTLNTKLAKISSYYILYKHTTTPTILPISYEEYSILTLLKTPHSMDELFDKLTVCQETFVTLFQKIFNVNFLKATHGHDSFCTTMRSDL